VKDEGAAQSPTGCIDKTVQSVSLVYSIQQHRLSDRVLFGRRDKTANLRRTGTVEHGLKLPA
jgi:hypothetical protein